MGKKLDGIEFKTLSKKAVSEIEALQKTRAEIKAFQTSLADQVRVEFPALVSRTRKHPWCGEDLVLRTPTGADSKVYSHTSCRVTFTERGSGFDVRLQESRGIGKTLKGFGWALSSTSKVPVANVAKACIRQLKEAVARSAESAAKLKTQIEVEKKENANIEQLVLLEKEFPSSRVKATTFVESQIKLSITVTSVDEAREVFRRLTGF